MTVDKLTVVFPTFHCPEYTEIVIRSFERFRPTNLEIKYVVVENSTDDSYREPTLRLAENVVWVQNPLDGKEDRPDESLFPRNAMHSYANAAGVERGLKEVTTEWVFIAHSDVCVTSQSFFDELLNQINEGSVLTGTVKDNSRVFAIHVSGYLTKNDLAQQITYYPFVTPKQGEPGVDILRDVGDELDLLCQKLGLKTFCYKNTENKDVLTDDRFASFPVDRCMDSKGNVMFMHLGRGADKMAGRYTKQGRILRGEWVDFCQQFL